MSRYAEILKNEDPRIAKIFNVEAETQHAGSQVIADPFPGLMRLLAQAPVHEGRLGELLGYGPEAGFHFHLPDHVTYSALSFEAVSRGLIQNEVFSSEGYELFPTNALFHSTILQKVGAEHRRLRAPIQPLFMPEAAETWWNDKIIAETVETLISKIEVKRSADLFLELCARMPVHVVSAAFGIDPDEIVTFRIALLGGADDQSRDRVWGEAKSREILARVIGDRRKNPQDDLISKLLAAEVEQEDGSKRPFTDEEIIGHCRLIMLAGGGTTWRQLGITLYALLNDPEQFEAVKADRSLVPRAILESARWHATDLVFPRRAAQDAELEGVAIPKGAIVHLCLGSANRDPRRWDNADKFDVLRPLQRSLAFAAGPHSCLGQHVSRQEMVVALNAVFDRLPNLRWDASKPPPRLTGGLFARGPTGLPVLFG